MQFKSPGAASLGIRGQSRRNQLKTIVEPSRNAVNRSNKSARSAADHPEPEAPVLPITRL
jgi:hypothetical protein